MTIKISAIKQLVKTGCARDVSTDRTITGRPFNSTIVFDSVNQYGQLSGLVLRNNETGELLAVIGRTSNLFLLAM